MSAWIWPSLPDFLLMVGLGVMAAVAMPLFVHAYKIADASFIAPFEYTAMFWAVVWGAVIFGDFPDRMDVERRRDRHRRRPRSCCTWTTSTNAGWQLHTG